MPRLVCIITDGAGAMVDFPSITLGSWFFSPASAPVSTELLVKSPSAASWSHRD